MKLKEFIEESDKWMKSIGFHLSTSEDLGSMRTYTNSKYNLYVEIKGDLLIQPNCKVIGNGLNNGIKLIRENIKFKDDNIMRVINSIDKYQSIIKNSR